MAEFLFEIGLEEVPARMLASAEAELARRTCSSARARAPHRARLQPADLLHTPPPRGSHRGRSRTPGRPERRSARPVGQDRLQGRHPRTRSYRLREKSGGGRRESLRTVTTSKGEYIAATSPKPGRSAAEVIAEELPKELAGIYWAKNMYWRPGKPERFVRPVRWLLCLLGTEIVPVTFGGKTAANLTYGHRVLHGPAPITIGAPADYQAALEAAKVLADVEARRHTIRKALDRVCRSLPATRWREDHALVDKLTHLTEWPTVICGGFEREFLTLPEEVLVTVMRDHQNYFAVEDLSGALAPYFLAVLNTESNAAGESVIRHGNERVLRARFNDARFFWEFDQRVPLVDRIPLLEKVTFQKDLGSYAAKTERVRDSRSRYLADAVQGYITHLKPDVVVRAARLAKTDLTTELVKEFTELQGVIGGLYARTQGEHEGVAAAIYDQYKPAGGHDSLPTTIEGAILGVADRLDTIAGMFKLGIVPTGSKDPFALRRAANAVVRIIAETEIGSYPPILVAAVQLARARHTVPDEPGVSIGSPDEILEFFRERVQFYLSDVRGHAYDVVAAVLAVGAEDVRDAVARAEAVTSMRHSEDFRAVCAAFKRIKNILAQANEKNFSIGEFKFMFATRPEADFWTQINDAGAGFLADCKTGAYVTALGKLAALRPIIDSYFEQTMVMVDDEEVRSHRLGMLRYLRDTFTQVADFSQLVTAG